jgi:hypothetical protein
MWWTAKFTDMEKIQRERIFTDCVTVLFHSVAQREIIPLEKMGNPQTFKAPEPPKQLTHSLRASGNRIKHAMVANDLVPCRLCRARLLSQTVGYDFCLMSTGIS